MDTKAHWEGVYGSKAETELSWHQSEPRLSMQLILDATQGRGRVIDVGGGSSVLVDKLLEQSFDRIAVLDISRAALERSKARLGEQAARVQWIEADITKVEGVGQFELWHDRAVFHFLIDPNERQRYA